MKNIIRRILAEVDGKISKLKGKPLFAVFDFDNSCVENDVADAVFAHLCRNNLLKDATLLGKKKYEKGEYHRLVFRHYYETLRRGDMKKAYIFCAKAIISGFSGKEIKKITEEAIAFEGKKIGKSRLYGVNISRGIRARNKVKKLMNGLRGRGIAIWIITSSPQIVAETAVKRYGFPGKAIGLKSEAKKGIFTAKIKKPYSIIEGKTACIRKFISSNNKPVLALGDSMNDLSMLQYAMISVAVGLNKGLSRRVKFNL